jgi:hypothetical protein
MHFATVPFYTNIYVWVFHLNICSDGFPQIKFVQLMQRRHAYLNKGPDSLF